MCQHCALFQRSGESVEAFGAQCEARSLRSLARPADAGLVGSIGGQAQAGLRRKRQAQRVSPGVVD